MYNWHTLNGTNSSKIVDYWFLFLVQSITMINLHTHTVITYIVLFFKLSWPLNSTSNKITNYFFKCKRFQQWDWLLTNASWILNSLSHYAALTNTTFRSRIKDTIIQNKDTYLRLHRTDKTNNIVIQNLLPYTRNMDS